MFSRAGPVILLLAGCAGEQRANDLAEAAEVRIAPGLWEIRGAVTSAQAQNLPILVRDRLVGPRPTRRLCITAAQAADAGVLAQRPDACVRRDVVLREGRLTGTMLCPTPGGAAPGVVTLNGAYESARYALRMEMAEPMPDGATLRLQVVTAGRRIGDC